MIGFALPWVLVGLLALPAIWWLLRLTPPRPQTETFPPLRLLAKVMRKEETPAHSPWWLTALRLGLAALVIIALAQPLLNPRTSSFDGNGPLLVMIDNGWARSATLEERTAQARLWIEDAAAANQPVAIAATVADPTTVPVLDSAETALAILDTITPVSGVPDRQSALERLLATSDDLSDASLVLLTDGVAHEGDTPFSAALDAAGLGSITAYSPGTGGPALTAIAATDNGATGMRVDLTSLGNAQAGATLRAFDTQGRLLAETATVLDDGELTALFDSPFELRNDFAYLALDGADHAGAVRLLDDSDRRRRVGLVSGVAGDGDQPLLSPLFYIRRALAPFTDIIEGRTGELARDIPLLIDQGPAMIILADVGVLPDEARAALSDWVDAGGTLVRFAGPRLATDEAAEDSLLPVRLRLGERSLGGALSWTEPQAVAQFPETGPFAGLAPPDAVTVERQVLAEPTADLSANTWAVLADGTPLVTGQNRGRGAVVLFHVTAEATWSNLPISGTFVEMLRRLSQSARNTGTVVQGSGSAAPAATATIADDATLPPLRTLQADGRLTPPPGHAEPLAPGTISRPNHAHPAGFYGTSDAVTALNILSPGDALEPFAAEEASAMSIVAYPAEIQTNLSAWFFAAALLLLAIDTLAILFINGRFSALASRRTAAQATGAVAIACLAALVLSPGPALAQSTPDTQRIDESLAIDLVSTTRVAYVVTGNAATDETSRTGLDGLMRFIASRTALEPDPPVGIDLAVDELAFYPLIYFPIDASADAPSEAAVSRLDAYMQNGGTVLFDTRDALTGALDGGNTPENERLRAILSGLNVPPLEPVPADHVLTKSFYILESFPGRYDSSPLWVEASFDTDQSDGRPVRAGDGVSTIMITGNDLAAAWALDEDGRPLAAVSGGDPLQRIYAFRTGVNIMMYMLTGNYKADQVHIPALLERLGQ